MPQLDVGPDQPNHSAHRRLPEACFQLSGGLAILVGSLVLVGWALDITALKSILPGWVSMKANTALAFVLLGLAVFNLQAPTFSTRLCGRLAGLIGLLALIEYVLDWNPGIDQWLFREAAGTVGTSHPGRMAPDTAFCFVLLAAGLEIIRRPRKTTATFLVSAILSALVTTMALVEILSYFTPVLRTYGWGGLTMMALPTATVFAALGVALALIAWRQNTLALARSAKPIGGSDSRAWFAFLLVFLLLAAGIIASGTFYYRSFEQHYRAEVERQLSTVAELKVAELALWRKERLGDGAILFKNGAFSSLVRRVFEQPGDAEAQRQLQSWVEKVHTAYQYDQVRLLDIQGLTRMAIPAGRSAMSSNVSQRLPEVVRSGQLTFQDFYRNEYDRRVYLAVLVPVLDEQNASRPLGVVVLRIDPEIYLYPFIKRWPIPNRTAETLLVRKEGSEVVFLNELRFQTNPALNFRAPLDRIGLPAAQAALGREGVMEGLDYRGVPVVAALRTIPDSPWSLVARMDAAEVYAPVRERLWQIVVLIGALIFGAGASVGLVWRQQHLRFYRERAVAAELVQKSEARLSFALQTSQIGAWDLDLLDHTAYRTLIHDQIFGYGTLLPRWTYELFLEHVLPEDRPEVDRRFREATAAQTDWNFECRIRRHDGEVRWIWAAGGHERNAEGKPLRMSGIVQDITQRKQQEREIERLTCLYATLSQVNQAIVRVSSRHELFAEVCRVLLEFGRFKMAWVGWVDPETKAVHPVGQAGDTTGYIESLRIFADDRPTGRGPVGTSLRTGRTYVCNDVFADPCMAAWLDAARAAGFAASISLPIRLRDQICGALVVYAVEAGCFGAKEVNLLEEAALDISFGLDHLAAATDRLDADGRLRASEARFHAILDGLHTHIAVLDEQGAILVVNAAWRQFAEKNGIAAGQVGEGVNYLQVCERASGPDAATAAAFAAGIREVLAGRRASFEIEYPCHSPAEQRWFVGRATPMPGEEARRVVVAHENITERKQAEATLNASETRYRRLFESAKDGILILDAETGMVVDVNPFLIELLGYSHEAFLGKKIWELGFLKDLFANQVNFTELQKQEYIRYEDMPLETGDGRRIEVEFVSNVYLVDHAKVIQCNIRDITARKRAENELRASEAKFRTLVEHIPQKIFVKDRDLRWLAVNATFAHDFGLPPEAMVGKSDFDFYPPEMAEKFRADDQRILESGQTEDLEEAHLLNGQEIWVHVVKAPVRDDRGEITGVFGIFWDITERKRSEAARLRLLHILESSLNEIYVFAADTLRFDYVNGAALRNLGFNLETLRGMTPVDLKPEFTAASFQQAIAPLLAGEQAQLNFKTIHRRADGSDYPVEVHLQLVELEGQRAFLAIIMDITERQRMEQEIQAMEGQLRQQQKLESIGTLASGVAHEINNPINGVMNYAQLIMDENPANPTTMEYAKEIIHETERVATIVRNLLQFARHDKAAHSPAYVHDIIEQTLALIRMVIKRDQITLQVELPKDLPEIKCRSQQIQQVLMNLLTNARDALNQRYQGHHEDKLIQVSCQPFEWENRRWVRITVDDHGAGIPAEVRDRVFDPFFTTKPRDVGTGLGLSISHGIVKDHHGKLWFESTPGQGTKFHVELPVDNGWEI